MNQHVRVIVTGRVQGVGYRAWTVREAHARGLSGWVRNRCDGTVEAVFSGDIEAVDAMAAACWKGPALARVAHIATSPCSDAIAPGFSAQPTV